MKRMEQKHYGAIDGLRAMAAIGIVLMHMGANNEYQISVFVYERMIPDFTNFVFLFMVISAFGMCCGYYEKILKGKISLSEFYGKRFKKILPFFAVLVALDLIMSPSLSSVYEGFADLTLLFGFLPNEITVIGVGWFLGLIFVFYLCFPFFCVLLENKRRAWIAFGVSLLYNLACTRYFEVGRKNILYSACFFLAGGLLYLYREQIARLNRWAVLAGVWASVILYFIIGGNAFMCLAVSVLLLLYAILARGRIFQNPAAKFLSGISMEIYLSHMVIFWGIEKLGWNRRFGTGWLQYLVTVALVVGCTCVFSFVMQKAIEAAERKYSRVRK